MQIKKHAATIVILLVTGGLIALGIKSGPGHADEFTTAVVVAGCGAQALPVGSYRQVTQDTSGIFCSGTGGAGTPQVVQGAPISIVDGSGQVTTGGASQQIFPADTARKYLFVQNPSATVSGVAAEDCFVNIGASASNAGGSYELSNLGSLQFDHNAIPTGAVNVTCPTQNHKFVAKRG